MQLLESSTRWYTLELDFFFSKKKKFTIEVEIKKFLKTVAVKDQNRSWS